MELDLSGYLHLSADNRHKVFLNSLSSTNRTPEYYVNWEKVTKNTKSFELELNTLNYLIGKPNILNEARELFKKQPHLLKAIPILIASRDKLLDVLIIDDHDNMDFYHLDFKKIDMDRLDTYIEFIEDSGLFEFLQNKATQNLVDYVYGVETGLDSNGRKNRSGKTMEAILERKVVKTCKKLGYQSASEATANWIKENWGMNVPVDKSNRRFDQAIFDESRKKLYLIETNYYGGGGSKLKAVAGEFSTLNTFIDTSIEDITFLWVTDGKGWLTANLPLLEAFNEIRVILNLEMLKKDFLYELIK